MEKVPIVTKTDCKNRVNWLKISQSINKKENPEIRSRIQEMDKKLNLSINYYNNHTLIQIPESMIERYAILEVQ